MNRDLTEAVDNAIIGSEPIQQAAQATQKAVGSVFAPPPMHAVKTVLNGTWLEHPLHPVITDVPVGAWTMTMVLDLLALVFGVKRLGKASAITTGIGILGALGAAVTGLADWVDVDPPELRVGLVHAVTNITATSLFAVSFVARRNSRWRIRKNAVIPALLGYLTVTVGAFLGGSLVFRRGVMVNRNAYRSGPNDFVPVIAVGDLPENTMKRVEANGQPVLVVRRSDRVYAIGAVCSHYGGPLEEGKLFDDVVECPWHYSRFSLDDGHVVNGPTTAPVPAYEARVNNGQVEVRQLAIG